VRRLSNSLGRYIPLVQLVSIQSDDQSAIANLSRFTSGWYSTKVHWMVFAIRSPTATSPHKKILSASFDEYCLSNVSDEGSISSFMATHALTMVRSEGYVDHHERVIFSVQIDSTLSHKITSVQCFFSRVYVSACLFLEYHLHSAQQEHSFFVPYFKRN